MIKLSKIKQRLKRNYTYSLTQICNDFDMNPNTLRSWVKQKENPLETVSTRPINVWSEDLRFFIDKRIKARKTKCHANQIFCMSCKKSQIPFEKKVVYQKLQKQVNMQGLCPKCFVFMNKRLSPKNNKSIQPMLINVTKEALDILRNNNIPVNIEKNKQSQKQLKAIKPKVLQGSLF